jgi:O-antigen/teichoic acid export membrane protein
MAEIAAPGHRPAQRDMGPWLRYGIAFAGPASTAGANFVLSLVLLRVMSADLFGHFSFLIVLSQFFTGIWSALFSAALPVIMSDTDEGARVARMATLFSANLASMGVAVPLFVAIGYGFHLPAATGVTFAVFAGLLLLRQFARTYAYVALGPVRVMASDVTYCVIVLAGLPVLLFAPVEPGPTAAAVLALAAGLALLLFGQSYLALQFAPFPRHFMAQYRAIWREHSGWSMLGVLTTEATMNAHAYIVTFFAGPAAFAVLSASSLLTRPVAVVTAALGEYERAQMARQIAAREAVGLARSLMRFRLAMIAVWVGTAALLAFVFLVVPHLIFPKKYALPVLIAGSVMWMIVSLVRVMRAPESAMMQGAGEFRPLAYASVWSAIFSVGGVALALAIADPVWSILGILAGEMVYGLSLWPKARAWRRRNLPVGEGA